MMMNIGQDERTFTCPHDQELKFNMSEAIKGMRPFKGDLSAIKSELRRTEYGLNVQNVIKLQIGLALAYENPKIYHWLRGQLEKADKVHGHYKSASIEQAIEKANRKDTASVLNYSFKASIVASNTDAARTIIDFSNRRHIMLEIDQETLNFVVKMTLKDPVESD